MKKIMIIALFAASCAVSAQHRENRHRGNFKDMTAEQIATLQTKKMTLALDLDEGQQQQIQVLNLENATRRKAKMEERMSQKKSEERQKPSSDELYAQRNERLDAAIAHKAALKQILSEEQFQKWERMRRHQKGKHKRGEFRKKKRA